MVVRGVVVRGVVVLVDLGFVACAVVGAVEVRRLVVGAFVWDCVLKRPVEVRTDVVLALVLPCFVVALEAPKGEAGRGCTHQERL